MVARRALPSGTPTTYAWAAGHEREHLNPHAGSNPPRTLHRRFHITPAGVAAIAKEAREKNVGARGLRSILERVLLDPMFHVSAFSSESDFFSADRGLQWLRCASRPILGQMLHASCRSSCSGLAAESTGPHAVSC